jgi:hypothetical protein
VIFVRVFALDADAGSQVTHSYNLRYEREG